MKLAEDYFEYSNEFMKLILPLIFIILLGMAVILIIDHITNDFWVTYIGGFGFIISGFFVYLILATRKTRG